MSAEPIGPPLIFAIHDLHPWGGQDRSTLEVIEQLSCTHQLEVVSYCYERLCMNSPRLNWHAITPYISRPVIIKILFFYLRSIQYLWRFRRQHSNGIIHSTGTTSLMADVFQVQFLHHAWKEIQAQTPIPHSRTHVEQLYDQGLLVMNCLFEKLLYTRHRHYIAIARSVQKDLEKFFSVEGQIRVIHHGVDSTVFHPVIGTEIELRNRLREQIGVNRDQIVLLLVGVYERKGLGILLEAVGRLPQTIRSQVHVLAVGSGNSHFYLNHAKQLGIEQQVNLRPHEKNILQYYQASDIFVLPTLYEPFGMVIIEAMACGLPPIVSRLAGASELTESGISSLLLEHPTDAEEVACQIEKLIRDRELRAAMSQRCRAIAVARSWERVAKEYALFLAEVAEKRAKNQ